MSKVNLAISGCMGRMGQQLIKSSRVDKNFKLTTLFLSFNAILRISKVQLGTVKSIIKSTFLKEFSLFKLGLIPKIFFFINIFLK